MEKESLDFKKARKAYDDNDRAGMKEFASELNKLLITSIWYNDIEGLEEVLDKTSIIMEKVNLKNEIKKERDYYYGFVWGIENMTRKILARREDFSDIDRVVKQTKHLTKIFSYLSDKGQVQHKDLAEHLGIGPSALTNFFVKNDLEHLKIIHTARYGKTKWYSLTYKGKKYLDLRRQKESEEVKTITNFIDLFTKDIINGKLSGMDCEQSDAWSPEIKHNFDNLIKSNALEIRAIINRRIKEIEDKARQKVHNMSTLYRDGFSRPLYDSEALAS